VNNVALGFSFLFVGLVVFYSALNKTTGAALAGLLYGSSVLKDPTAAPTDAPVSQAQADAAWKAPVSATNPKAGVVPVTPLGGVPGITVPIIPNDKMG